MLQSGDTNGNGMLDPGETWIYTLTGTAPAGWFENIAKVQRSVANGSTSTTTTRHGSTERARHQARQGRERRRPVAPDARPRTPTAPLRRSSRSARTVVFTYLISNPGNIGLCICRPELAACNTQQGISDDNGTPNNTGDDFSPVYVAGDTNGTGVLDPGEMWLFAATGTAVGGGVFQLSAAATAATVAATVPAPPRPARAPTSPGPTTRSARGCRPGTDGKGNANGKPAAGTVGNADTKNPPGQVVKFVTSPDNGYECDGNSGIAQGNPAHSSCAGKVIYINTATALGTVTLTDNSVLSVVANDKAAYLTATPVVASVANASMPEGNSGTKTMNVTVTLGPRRSRRSSSGTRPSTARHSPASTTSPPPATSCSPPAS